MPISISSPSMQLVELAHKEAEAIVAMDPMLSPRLARPEYAELPRAVERRWAQARPIGEEAG